MIKGAPGRHKHDAMPSTYFRRSGDQIRRFRGQKEMAGAVGFEPTIHDTKNRCLTIGYAPIASRLESRGNVATKIGVIKPDHSSLP